MDASKLILYVSITVFGLLGTYLPVWTLGEDPLGGWSILGSLIGGFVGIWVWFKLKDSIG